MKLKPFFSSWKVIAIYFLLILWESPNITFYALRPSDLWLVWALFSQRGKAAKKINGYELSLLLLALLSQISNLIFTIIEGAAFKPQYFFSAYIFIRIFIIARIARNIFWQNGEQNKLLNFFMIAVVSTYFIVLCQYYLIEPLNIQTRLFFSDKNDYTVLNTNLTNNRIIGTIGNPNYLGFLICLCSFLYFTKILSRFSLINFSILLFSVYLIVFATASRSAILILGIGILIYTVFNKGSSLNKSIRILLILLLSVVVVSLVSIGDAVPQRIESLFHNGYNDDLLFEPRIQFWQSKISLVESNLLYIIWGHGVGSIFSTYSDNMFLTFFLNYGFVGIVLFLFILTSSLRKTTLSLKNNSCAELYNNQLVLMCLIIMIILGNIVSEVYLQAKIGPIVAVFFAQTFNDEFCPNGKNRV